MASPRPDPLRRVDRVLAPLTWLIAAFAIVVLFSGPELIGAAKTATGNDAAAGGSGSSTAPSTAPKSTGATVFAAAGCGACHTLAAADATGSLGPNLDQLKPDAAAVTAVVTSGRGSMPAFGGDLSAAEIQAVADYVATSAGR
jgi:mono/diheme cytochrome c family protein